MPGDIVPTLKRWAHRPWWRRPSRSRNFVLRPSFDAAIAQKRSNKCLPRKLQVPYSAIGYSISLALQYTSEVRVEIKSQQS